VLAETGKEPVTSMGNDRPLAVFSAQRPPLYKFCKQIVAVVTNPPLDPLREGSAFDLTTHLGESPIVHEDAPNYDVVPQYRLSGPILDTAQAAWIKAAADAWAAALRHARCDLLRPRGGAARTVDPRGGRPRRARHRGTHRRTHAAGRLAGEARRGAGAVSVGRRRGPCRQVPGTPRPLPVPMLLLVGQVHNALIAEGLRRHTGLLVECGDVLEGHDAAMLMATGATAVCPHVLLRLGAGEVKPAPDKPFTPVAHLARSLEDAVRRIMSKMGICTLDGYRGSGLYEIVGLSAAVVDYYLPGIQSRIGGLELADVFEDIRHRGAIGARPVTDLDPNVYRKEVWQATPGDGPRQRRRLGPLHGSVARHTAGVSARPARVP
jgi:glutamate synthase (NADPH/NADH) large chain